MCLIGMQREHRPCDWEREPLVVIHHQFYSVVLSEILGQESRVELQSWVHYCCCIVILSVTAVPLCCELIQILQLYRERT